MQALAFISALLPLIHMVVSFAEAFHPTPGSGAAKLQFVVETIGKIAEHTPGYVNEVQAIKTAAVPVIENIVKLMNDLKVVLHQPGSVDQSGL